MKKRRRVSIRRLSVIIVIVLALLASAGIIAVYAGRYMLDKQTPQMMENLIGDNVPLSERRGNVITILAAATDQDATRTDSIMVITFDLDYKTTDILNIPRDTLVETSREGEAKKINAAYGVGIEELKLEVSEVIGYMPDRYVIFDFDGIANIIDSIGGIDYDIPFDMSYHDASQDLSIEFEEGYQHLNGKQVVEFLRWRHNDDDTGYEDGDNGRVTKLQDFLKVLAGKLVQPQNLIRLPKMAATIRRNIESDLSGGEMTWLGLEGIQSVHKITTDTLPGDGAEVEVGLDFPLWFHIVDETMALEMINERFNPYEQPITDLLIETPDTLGTYSSNWINEKMYRYQLLQRDFVYDDPLGWYGTYGVGDTYVAGDGYQETSSEDSGGDGDENGYDDGYDSGYNSGYDDGYDSY